MLNIPPSVDSVVEIFNQAIIDFHKDQNGTNVFFHADNLLTRISQGDFQANNLPKLLYEKAWVDTVQWHLEDEIRCEEIAPITALEIKRHIDKLNQYRTDLVERLEEFYAIFFQNINPAKDARVNTETLGWALDRLSILGLKIYHMQIEATRDTQSPQLKIRSEQQWKILGQQQKILIRAITEFIRDIQLGKAYFHTYKQMKMYNDPNLNPILYQNR